MSKLKFNEQNNMIELEETGIQIQVWRFDDEDEKADELTKEIIKRYNMHDELMQALQEIYNCQYDKNKTLANLNGTIAKWTKEIIEKEKP